MTTKPRLIAVVGATGTGKSDLAVALASRFNGEILNGDAMQLYQGLPVITNKIPVSDRRGIPHHLLGCIGLDEQPWTVGRFVPEALKIIAEIRSRGKLPILVGGTHYYTQSLLFNDALAGHATIEDRATIPHSSNESPKDPGSNGHGTGAVDDTILDASTEEILAKLTEVDPVMASRWHPNERRKIKRSLEIWLQTGRKASDIYAEQKARQNDETQGTANGTNGSQSHAPANGSHTESGGSAMVDDQGGLRADTLIFWIHADTDSLYERLNMRVDKMMQHGLLDEVRELSSYAEEHPHIDRKSGIWVSIGYKEFLPYMAYQENLAAESQDLTPAASTHVTTEAKLLKEAIEATQAGTRHYAKRQVNWIRIKLLNALKIAKSSNNGRLYLLNGTSLDEYCHDVVAKAETLTERWLNADEMPDPTTLSETAAQLLKPKRDDLSNSIGKWERQYCQACDMVGTTPSDWEQHIKSRRHKHAIAKARKAKHGQSDADTRPVVGAVNSSDSLK
ncbi:tRNA dimethylallyltransferase [Sphaceloma murrayae]|uniref:tRNA dimethylallyltransferase n=1 Tax=Sphaceloma murrayae TaxID=2082308 RepID=A0A2K1QWG6_9PEZI|nr:tRNA dimethylallyltransferase [Sphaceloma murrayae]